MYSIFRPDNHLQQCSELISSLHQNKEYADITLVSDENFQFDAHAFLLSNASSVFKSILEKNDNPRTYLYLRGIHQKELRLILQLIYIGEANVEEESFEEFLKVANELGLNDFGDQFLTKNFRKESSLGDRNITTEKEAPEIETKDIDIKLATEEHGTTDFVVNFEIENLRNEQNNVKQEEGEVVRFDTIEFEGASILSSLRELRCKLCEYKYLGSWRHLSVKIFR